MRSLKFTLSFCSVVIESGLGWSAADEPHVEARGDDVAPGGGGHAGPEAG